MLLRSMQLDLIFFFAIFLQIFSSFSLYVSLFIFSFLLCIYLIFLFWSCLFTETVSLSGLLRKDKVKVDFQNSIFIRPFEKRSYCVTPLGVRPSVNFFDSV